jgi:hypothetical protein
VHPDDEQVPDQGQTPDQGAAQAEREVDAETQQTRPVTGGSGEQEGIGAANEPQDQEAEPDKDVKPGF